jgi:O-antigen ligase
VVVIVTFFGLNTHKSIPRLPKLFWFIGIPLVTALATRPERIARLAGCYAIGTGILALWRIGHSATKLWQAIPAETNIAVLLTNMGSMTDGQRLMLGLLITIGFIWLCHKLNISAIFWWILLAVQMIAFVMNLKRGSWLAFFFLCSVFIVWKVRMKHLWLPIVVLLSLLLILPVSRTRLLNLVNEITPTGGRTLMWTKVAPELIKKYPMGIGERALTNEMMRKIDPKIEPNRDHLHSNLLQVLVSAGWTGLALYILWMTASVADAIKYIKAGRRSNVTDEILSVVIFLMLMALILNGLVEYNLGDAELVLAYGFIIGMAGAGRLRLETSIKN